MTHMVKVQNIQSVSSCENRVENKDAPNNFLQVNADFLLRLFGMKNNIKLLHLSPLQKKYLQKHLNCLSQFSSHLLFPHSEGKSDILLVRLQRPCDNVTNSRAAMC